MCTNAGGARIGGKSAALTSLGLKQEQSVDMSLFNFFDTRYGSYAKQLAQEANEYNDDELLVSFTKGSNKAYASIDEDSDTLVGIFSTGGGTGTELLTRVMEYQQKKGRGLNWMADNKESIKYYNKLGLGSFATGSSTKLYDIPADKIGHVISKLKGR